MNRKLYTLAMAGLVLAPLCSTAQAQIDQANYGNEGAFAYSHFGNGQSFTPSYNTSRGAGFNLADIGGGGSAGTLFIELRTSANGPAIASGSTAFALTPGSQSMFDVFWAPVAVTPSSVYYLTMITVGSEYAVATTGTYTSDQYAGGGWLYNADTNMSSTYFDYTQYGYDLTFEEYYSEVAAVPEPASIVLLGTGLLGVFGIARRRRNSAV